MVSETTRTPVGGKIDKIERYGWTTKDKPGDLKWVDKKLLIVDQSYQRAHAIGKVRKLSSNWSWVACGAITIGNRNDVYYVIDGQHRVLAAQSRSDIIDLPCVVFETTTNREEAKGFLNANICRKPIGSFATFKAKLIAKDEDAIYLQKLLSDLGMVISNHGKQSSVTYISSCFNMMKINRLKFEQTMKLVSELCREEFVTDKLAQGLFYIAMYSTSDLDDPRLRTRIKKIGVAPLTKSALKAAAYYTRGGAKVWGMGILEEINKGLRNPFEFKE